MTPLAPRPCAAICRALLALLCAALFGAPGAHAHPDWYLARLKPPNGGQLRNAGGFHMELVVTAQEIRLYVTDHFFNKFPTKNSSATAIVVHGDKLIKVELTPAGDNQLAAPGDFAQEADVRIGILLNAHRYPPQAARFTPFAKPSALTPPPTRWEELEAAGANQ